MLRPGSRIAVVAPGGAVAAAGIEPGIAWLERCGWEPVLGPNVLSRHRYLAGHRDHRAADPQPGLARRGMAAIHGPVLSALCDPPPAADEQSRAALVQLLTTGEGPMVPAEHLLGPARLVHGTRNHAFRYAAITALSLHGLQCRSNGSGL